MKIIYQVYLEHPKWKEVNWEDRIQISFRANIGVHYEDFRIFEQDP